MARKSTNEKRREEGAKWLERIADVNPDAVILEGYETCIVGLAERYGINGPVLAYDYQRCIEVLIKRDDMSYDEAVEFFEFNTLGGWFGDGTSIFVTLKLPD